MKSSHKNASLILTRIFFSSEDEWLAQCKTQLWHLLPCQPSDHIPRRTTELWGSDEGDRSERKK